MPTGKTPMLHPVLVELMIPVRERRAELFANQAQPRIFRILRRVETDDVIGREPPEQPLIGGQRARHIRRRPRDVKEEPDPVLEAQPAKLHRERNEVIIVDPDHVVRPQERSQRLREDAVHPEIAFRFGAVDLKEVQTVMADGPERPIGEASVIEVVVAPGEVQNSERDLAGLNQVGGGRRTIDGLSGPAEPEPALLLQRPFERDREPACTGGPVLRRDGHPVRHHDEALTGRKGGAFG